VNNIIIVEYASYIVTHKWTSQSSEVFEYKLYTINPKLDIIESEVQPLYSHKHMYNWDEFRYQALRDSLFFGTRFVVLTVTNTKM